MGAVVEISPIFQEEEIKLKKRIGSNIVKLLISDMKLSTDVWRLKIGKWTRETPP